MAACWTRERDASACEQVFAFYPDGYHLLDAEMLTLDLADTVELDETEDAATRFTVATEPPAGAKDAVLGSGELTILPAAEGLVSINKLPYRGRYRLVPLSGSKFDVVNDVDIESYLCGVLPKELLPNWHEETYRAQAIVARTYALYEKQTAPPDRYWDVYADQRSQRYGGLSAESDKSRDAVNQTAGIVLAYAPAGGRRC